MRDHLNPIDKLARFSTPRSFMQDMPYLVGAASVLFLLIEWSI